MSFRRFYEKVAGTWTLERSDTSFDLVVSTVIGNVSLATARTRARQWLATKVPDGELLDIYIVSLSPLHFRLYRKTKTNPGDAIPANWWVR